jgi:DNA-directed RNA polymerase specialized sigma24 family protein
MIDPTSLPDAEDPEQAFAAVLALRRLADTLERKAVRVALRKGWSWTDIAQALGISKQAAHKRLSGVAPR